MFNDECFCDICQKQKEAMKEQHPDTKEVCATCKGDFAHGVIVYDGTIELCDTMSGELPRRYQILKHTTYQQFCSPRCLGSYFAAVIPTTVRNQIARAETKEVAEKLTKFLINA